MRELADFLKSFGNDTTSEKRYKEYFDWRRDYRVMGYQEAYGQSWCELCGRLGNNDKRKVYDDIGAWWSREKDCGNAQSELFNKWGIEQ